MSDVNYKQLVRDVLKEWSANNPEHELGKMIADIETLQKIVDDMSIKINEIKTKLSAGELEESYFEMLLKVYLGEKEFAWCKLYDIQRKLGLK